MGDEEHVVTALDDPLAKFAAGAYANLDDAKAFDGGASVQVAKLRGAAP